MSWMLMISGAGDQGISSYVIDLVISGIVRFQHQCLIYASGNRVSIRSDNGLSPIRRQAIIWINAMLLSIGPSGTNFREILIMTSSKYKTFFHSRKRLRNCGHFVQGRLVNKARPKQPAFCGRNFQIHFLKYELLYWSASTCLDNDLAQNSTNGQ